MKYVEPVVLFAAALLVSENPGVFDANKDLPKASQQFLADGGYLVDANGVFGTQTLERWTAYSAFLYEQGLLVVYRADE